MDHGTATACQRHKSDILFKKILERNEMFRSVSIHTQLPPLPFRLSLIIFLNSYNDINYEYNWTRTFMKNSLFIYLFWKNLRNWEMDRQYWEIDLTYNHICCNKLTRISYLVYNWDKSNTHPDIRYPLKIITPSTIGFQRFLYPPTQSIIYMLQIFRVMTVIIIYFSNTSTDHYRAILKTIDLIDKTIDNIPV